LFPEHNPDFPKSRFGIHSAYPYVWPDFIIYEAMEVVPIVTEVIWCRIKGGKDDKLAETLACYGLDTELLYK
jgi:hypothetical protein